MNKRTDLTRRVAIYARLSPEDQANTGEGSLERQIHRCRQYLTNLGHDSTVIDTIRVYSEEGLSGKDTNWPEFDRLMGDIRNNKVALLVFTDIHRVSRSVFDFLGFNTLLSTHGVEFISIRERIDTANPQGKVILAILRALSDYDDVVGGTDTDEVVR